AGADFGLGVEDLLVSRLAGHAAAAIERPQRLGQVDRVVDLDGAGDRRGAQLLHLQAAEVAVDHAAVGPASLPADAEALVELEEGVGAGGIDHGEPRRTLDRKSTRLNSSHSQ